jgi:hypothetical protein
VKAVFSKNASERNPSRVASDAGNALMSSTPTAWPSRVSGPIVIGGASASGTLTSWPDMRRPVKVSPFGAQPTSCASASAEERRADARVEREPRLDVAHPHRERDQVREVGVGRAVHPRGRYRRANLPRGTPVSLMSR